MSIHDDSSTVLSVRGSEASGPAPSPHPDKPPSHDQPDVYSKSPYTDPEIISLDVGLLKSRYLVHRAVLAQSPELSSKPSLKLWGDKTNDAVALPELDAVTAHTLVTFLYTGRYETLAWLGAPEKAALAAYKLSTCVYCAAVRYKLPGLAALAQEKIAAGGNELGILDVLGVARDHAFPVLPDGEPWFAAYLEGTITRAAGADPGLFTKPGFVDQIEGDRRFRQVVMRAVVSTYAGGVGGGDNPPMATVHTEDPEVRKAPDGDGTGFVEYAASPALSSKAHRREQDSATAANDDNEDAVQLDDIEPTIPDSPVHRPASPLSPAAPESVTDELDFQNSKMYQSMGHTAGHVRHDSVIQAEETAPVVEENGEKSLTSSAAEVTSPTVEVPSPVPEVVNGTITSGKKKKGKKGKKSGTTFV